MFSSMNLLLMDLFMIFFMVSLVVPIVCYEILINSSHLSSYFMLFLIRTSFICLELEDLLFPLDTIIDHSSYPFPSVVPCSQGKELPPLKLLHLYLISMNILATRTCFLSIHLI